MNPEFIAAICTGIVSIVAAVGALIASLRNGNAIKKDAIVKDEKLHEIHVLVNSRLTEALTEIALLRKFVAEVTGTPWDEYLARKANVDAGMKPPGGKEGVKS